MQFFLFDLAATLLFLVGYRTVVALRQGRALPVTAEPAARARSGD